MLPTQQDYQLRAGETPEQYNARITAQRGTDVNRNIGIAKSAGASGASMNDLADLFGATPEEQQAQRNNLAQQFGFENFDAFTLDVFRKPSKSTQDIYDQAYQAAGLPDLLERVTKAKGDLNTATGKINENPWLAESGRVGRVKRLQDLAGTDIQNMLDEYELKQSAVKELVSRYSADLSDNEKRNEALFKYLTQAAEERATGEAAKRLNTYTPDYLKAKSASQKPDTINVGGDVWQWDPEAGRFKFALKGPGPKKTDTENVREAKAAAIAEAKAELLRTRGEDTYVNPDTYQSLREDFAAVFGDPSAFDEAYSNRLSPAERARLGIGKAVGVKASESGREL